MAYLMKAKKCDLLMLCDELGIDVGTNKTVVQLIKMIKESDDFDEDFAKSRLELIKEDREREKEMERLEREKEMERLEREKEREFELRRLEITSRSEVSGENRSEPSNVVRNQNSQNIMPRFDGSGDISIYLALFEKQISRLDISRENWVMHLLNLLPLEFANIISRESDSFADDYNYVKNLLLKRFKLTAEEFRQKFITHKKQHSANWRDFAFELRNYFDEWIQGMNVDNYEDLKELIITDRIKQNLPYDIQEHFIDELPSIKNVQVLVNKLDDYEAARRSFKKFLIGVQIILKI